MSFLFLLDSLRSWSLIFDINFKSKMQNCLANSKDGISIKISWIFETLTRFNSLWIWLKYCLVLFVIVVPLEEFSLQLIFSQILLKGLSTSFSSALNFSPTTTRNFFRASNSSLFCSKSLALSFTQLFINIKIAICPDLILI